MIVKYAFELDEAGVQYMDHVFFSEFDVSFPADEQLILVTGRAKTNGAETTSEWVVSAALNKHTLSRDALTMFAETINNLSSSKPNPHEEVVVIQL